MDCCSITNCPVAIVRLFQSRFRIRALYGPAYGAIQVFSPRNLIYSQKTHKVHGGTITRNGGTTLLRGKTILLGVTGGIAAYKAAYLASALHKQGCHVHVLMTQNATNFINPITFESLTETNVS